MKITLNLNDALWARAKGLATQQGISLSRLVEEGLQLRLLAKRPRATRPETRLPVFKGRGGLVDGLDATSNKALLRSLAGED